MLGTEATTQSTSVLDMASPIVAKSLPISLATCLALSVSLSATHVSSVLGWSRIVRILLSPILPQPLAANLSLSVFFASTRALFFLVSWHVSLENTESRLFQQLYPSPALWASSALSDSCSRSSLSLSAIASADCSATSSPLYPSVTTSFVPSLPDRTLTAGRPQAFASIMLTDQLPSGMAG